MRDLWRIHRLVPCIQSSTFRSRPGLIGLLVTAMLVFAVTPVIGPKLRLERPHPNDPLHPKGLEALAKAAKVAKLDRHHIALGLMEEPNAAYAGNGQFILGKPFLQYPQQALDAIMAHEVGHAVLHHVEKGMLLRGGLIGGLGMLGATLSPTGGEKTGQQVGAIVTEFVFPKFSRKEEYEADAYGVKLLRHEGYPQPNQVMADALGILLQNFGNSGGHFFDTHPATADRIHRLTAK